MKCITREQENDLSASFQKREATTFDFILFFLYINLFVCLRFENRAGCVLLSYRWICGHSFFSAIWTLHISFSAKGRGHPPLHLPPFSVSTPDTPVRFERVDFREEGSDSPAVVWVSRIFWQGGRVFQKIQKKDEKRRFSFLLLLGINSLRRTYGIAYGISKRG